MIKQLNSSIARTAESNLKARKKARVLTHLLYKTLYHFPANKINIMKKSY